MEFAIVDHLAVWLGPSPLKLLLSWPGQQTSLPLGIHSGQMEMIIVSLTQWSSNKVIHIDIVICLPEDIWQHLEIFGGHHTLKNRTVSQI